MKNTSEADAFAILEEVSVAKGIRRIVGATGETAVSALKLGEAFDERLAKMEAAAKPTEEDVTTIGKEIDAAAISAVVKPLFQQRIGKLRKALKKAKKKKKGKIDPARLDALRSQIYESGASAPAPGFVILRPDSSDTEAVQQLLREEKFDVAVLALMESDDGKVSCCSFMPESCQANGFKADAWLRAALAPLGGRGGGKPGQAQGSAPGNQGNLAEAEAAAKAYWP